MPQTDKQNSDKKSQGDRHKSVVILSVIAVILIGIFLIILFFFHGNLYSSSHYPSGIILFSQAIAGHNFAGGEDQPSTVFIASSAKTLSS